MLIEQSGGIGARLPFAAPIKLMVNRLIEYLAQDQENMLDALACGEIPKTTVMDMVPGRPTLRRLYQTLGTEWGRDLFGERFWCECWEVRKDLMVKQFSGDDRPVIVADDVRFMSEVETIKSHEGVIVEVVRNSVDNTEDVMSHRSEAGLPKECIDFTLHNNGTLNELAESVGLLLSRINP